MLTLHQGVHASPARAEMYKDQTMATYEYLQVPFTALSDTHEAQTLLNPTNTTITFFFFVFFFYSFFFSSSSSFSR
jgi:hypothetical protein